MSCAAHPPSRYLAFAVVTFEEFTTLVALKLHLIAQGLIAQQKGAALTGNSRRRRSSAAAALIDVKNGISGMATAMVGMKWAGSLSRSSSSKVQQQPMP